MSFISQTVDVAVNSIMGETRSPPIGTARNRNPSEKAAILAILGFIPGVIIALAIYHGISTATGLPVAMDFARAIIVFLGTITACTISGALATRRLKSADPAELF